MLIRESRAKLVRSPLDILVDLGWADPTGKALTKKPIARTSFNLFENKVIDVLEGAGGPLHTGAPMSRLVIGGRDCAGLC